MKEEDYAKILIDLEKAGPLKRIEYPDFYATLSDDKKRVIFQEKHSTKKSVEIIEIGVLERRGFAIS